MASRRAAARMHRVATGTLPQLRSQYNLTPASTLVPRLASRAVHSPSWLACGPSGSCSFGTRSRPIAQPARVVATMKQRTSHQWSLIRTIVTADTQSSQPRVFVSVVRDTDGNVTLYTPLPKGGGLHSVHLGAEATVADLQHAMQGADEGVTNPVVRAPNGERLASSTRLETFIGEPWTLALTDDLVVGSVGASSVEAPVVTDGVLSDAYETFKSKLLSSDARTVSVQDFEHLAREVVVASVGQVPQEQLQAITARWKWLLEEEELLVHLKASAVSELAETLFLQPKLSRRNLTKALDIGRENVATDLTQKQAELDTFIAERKELYRDLDVAKQQARRYVNRWAFLGGLGGMAQFGGLAYFVYEVSWDTMEPITYFLGLGWTCAFYAFFLRYRADPTYDNMFDHMYHWQLKKRLRARGIEENELENVNKKIAERKADINVLRHRLS